MRAGLEHIKNVQENHGITDGLCLKNRSDVVIFKRDLFDDYENIPLVKFESFRSCFNLKQRLLVLSIDKYMMYTSHDFLMLGLAEDMINYWNQPLTDSSCDQQPRSIIEACDTNYIPETFFVRNFCLSKGYTLSNTYEDSYHVYRNLFYVWDFKCWKLVWLKQPELGLEKV